jgi:AraC-like DNA-binding protein
MVDQLMNLKSGTLKYRKPPRAILIGGRKHKIIGGRIRTNHRSVNKCLDFLADNFRKPIQIKDCIEISGMSRRGLLKAFHRCLGTNPGVVLSRIRIEYAKRFLIEHDLILKQIAKHCGYRSENTFCVAFQRATGMAPKKFQRQYLFEVYRHQNELNIQSTIKKETFPAALSFLTDATESNGRVEKVRFKTMVA